MALRFVRLSPTRAYLGHVAFASAGYALFATLQIVYQIQVVGLSPLQLVLIGTVLEATVFLFEIPTGVIADRYSRRLSMTLGAALTGVAFLLQGLVPTFWAALLCSFIWGIGFSFLSGAGQAWLVDEIGKDKALPAFTRARQVDLTITIIGTLAAGALGLIYLGLPLIVAGVMFLLLALFLIFFMTEEGWKRTPSEVQTPWKDLVHQVSSGTRAVRKNRVVRVIVLVSLFVGLSSEAFDRLWTDRILTDYILPDVFGLDASVFWFTLFALVGTGISLVVSLVVNRVGSETFNNLHPNRLLAVLIGIQVLGIAAMAVSPWLALALTGLWLREAAVNLAYPVQVAWMNRNLDSGPRATVMSMSSQVNSVGQVIGGPALGAVGSRVGLSAAILGSAIVLAPAIVLFAMLRRDKDGVNPDDIEPDPPTPPAPPTPGPTSGKPEDPAS